MVMEVSSSSSSPLSIHSPFAAAPCRRSRAPSIRLPVSSFWGSSVHPLCSIGAAKTQSSPLRVAKKKKHRFLPIRAVFERFTERAIKAVVFSQREAKSMGKPMVFTQHLLLGLIAEDHVRHHSNHPSAPGFLGSAITLDGARAAVLAIWHNQHQHDDAIENDVADEHQNGGSGGSSSSKSSSPAHVPFSISTKRVFEAAVEYSRTMGHNFIAPEHIAIGLFTVDDGSASRVLKRSFSPSPELLTLLLFYLL